jgi:hypothetical protein
MKDLLCAELVGELYDHTFDSMWDHFWPEDGSYVAHRSLPDADVIVWRGSVSITDWLQDFNRAALPTIDPDLGMVHPGFIAGVRAASTHLLDVCEKATKPLWITGHSLGAAHAALHAALLTKLGRQIERVVLFGCPRPGYADLRTRLEPVNIHSYRNQCPEGHDLVTDVPVWDGSCLYYVDVRAFTTVAVSPPTKIDAWGPLAYHHLWMYLTGVAAMERKLAA